MGRRLALPLGAALFTFGLGYAILDGGGENVTSWNSCLVILGLTLLALRFVRPKPDDAPDLGPWLKISLVSLIVWVTFQILPLPLPLIRIFSPARAELADGLAAVLPRVAPRPYWVPLSASPTTTFIYLLRAMGCVVGFLLMRDLTWQSRRKWRWTPFFPWVAVGSIEAVVGLIQSNSNAVAAGTYSNKNHFAGLLEMVLPLTVAFGLALGGPMGLAALAAAAVVLLAIIDSLSKMGFVAALGGLFVMGVVASIARFRGVYRWLVIAVICLVILGGFLFLPTSQTVHGIGSLFTDDNTGEGRFPVWVDSLRLIKKYLFFGVGLGNYGTTFVKYQTTSIDRAFNFAHNDYVELLAELGLPGFLLLLSSAWVIFAQAIRAALGDTSRRTHCLGLGCAGALTAIGLHSLTDYNLYISTNALVVACIAGIGSGLSLAPAPPEDDTEDDPWEDDDLASEAQAEEPQVTSGGPQKAFGRLAVAVSLIVVLYSSAWIVFYNRFRSDPAAESAFCRFGICDIDSVLQAQVLATQGGLPEAALGEVLEAVRRNPAGPGRWDQLAEAFWRSGQIDLAQQCFSRALALGPEVPVVLLDSADFYHSQGQDELALANLSKGLRKTAEYQADFFSWFSSQGTPMTEVLSHGLPPDANVYRAYLHYLITLRGGQGASDVWEAIRDRGYMDEKAAHEYAAFEYNNGEFDSAVRAWANYLGDRRDGYLETNWLLNGDFELEPTNLPFDWSFNSADGIQISRDKEVKHSGLYSLRIRFDGSRNLSEGHVSQTARFPPGRYYFEAFLKSRDLSTDQGFGIRVFDPSGPAHLDLKSAPILGTKDWTRVNLDFCITPVARELSVVLFRQLSLKFDNKVKGTLWLDSVRLARLSPKCS